MQNKQKNISWFTAFLLGLTLSSFSCQKDDLTCPVYSSEAQIKYGTSFGMCHGYCIKDYTLNEEKITLIQTGRGVQPDTCIQAMNAQRWKEMIVKVDIEKYAALPDTIGCPDCADGGAEWVEVFDGSASRKIFFEFNKEPEELKSLLADVRAATATVNCTDN